jgi:hypothetical protein
VWRPCSIASSLSPSLLGIPNQYTSRGAAPTRGCINSPRRGLHPSAGATQGPALCASRRTPYSPADPPPWPRCAPPPAGGCEGPAGTTRGGSGPILPVEAGKQVRRPVPPGATGAYRSGRGSRPVTPIRVGAHGTHAKRGARPPQGDCRGGNRLLAGQRQTTDKRRPATVRRSMPAQAPVMSA